MEGPLYKMATAAVHGMVPNIRRTPRQLPLQIYGHIRTEKKWKMFQISGHTENVLKHTQQQETRTTTTIKTRKNINGRPNAKKKLKSKHII